MPDGAEAAIRHQGSKFIQQLFNVFAVARVFVAIGPVVQSAFRFILHMLTQELVHLQVIVQRLPFAIDPERNWGRFEEIDQFTFPIPSRPARAR